MKEKPESEKKSHDDPRIQYDSYTGPYGRYCGNCTMFIAAKVDEGNRCTDVVAPINRSGWCKIWKEKQ